VARTLKCLVLANQRVRLWLNALPHPNTEQSQTTLSISSIPKVWNAFCFLALLGVVKDQDDDILGSVVPVLVQADKSLSGR